MTGLAIVITALVSSAVTVLIVLVIANLMGHEKKIKHEIPSLYTVADEQFQRSMGNLLPPAMREGNRITTLINGQRIFPAMLDAISIAERTVCIETFIWWSGAIGHRFMERLCERARAGVEVNVLVDWLGSKKIDPHHVTQLKEAGVNVELYHPLHWYNAWRVNQRTHRKLLVIDGKVGFIGGVGIADAWDGDATECDHWRDNHYRLEGPSVAQMQSTFLDNWTKTHSRVQHGEEYFPALEVKGDCLTQVFASSPQEGSESMRLMFLLSFASAAERIRLASAYFVPDDLLVQTLVEAAKRGVEIDIIVPGPNIDSTVARRAGRARWGALLEAGIRIHEYMPCRYHCKVMVVDDRWVSVGSTNFDNRSLRLNDEANLNVLDVEFAREQAELFERDLQRTRPVTLEQWRNRPLREKLVERAAELFRSQL